MIESEERPLKIRKLDLLIQDCLGKDSSPITGVVELNTKSKDQPHLGDGDVKEQPQSSEQYDDTFSSFDKDYEIQVPDHSQPLSKSQLKKLRKQEVWEAGREYRKAKKKEREKAKKSRNAEERSAATEAQSVEKALPNPQSSKETHPRRQIQVPITFLLDCDFDELMTEKELKSLGSQVTRCYSEVRSAPYRAHLAVCSFGGKLKQRFETVLANNHLGWKGVVFTQDDFVTTAHKSDVFMRSPQGGRSVGAIARALTVETESASNIVQKTFSGEASSESGIQSMAAELNAQDHTTTSNIKTISTPLHEATGFRPVLGEFTSDATSPPSESNSQRVPSIVYLTSDSPHLLEVLSPYTTYIIGGIVDKNRHKGICYKRAVERNVPTAKLPIGEYMTMQSRSVLATNHVVEIMVKWLEYGDWAKAFLSVIPKRKEPKLKVVPKTNSVEDKSSDTLGRTPQLEIALEVDITKQP